MSESPSRGRGGPNDGRARESPGRPPVRESSRRRCGASFGERGQTTTLEYTLTLALASVVVVGLMVGAGDFVTEQRDRVIQTELNVVGQQLADEIGAADRLVQSGADTETLEVTASLPATVAGSGYSVALVTSGPTQRLVLSTADPNTEVLVRVETTTPLEPVGLSGGELRIVYQSDQLRLQK